MSVLTVVTREDPHPGDGPLLDSLRHQTSSAWRLADSIPGDSTGATAVLVVDASTRLEPHAVAALLDVLADRRDAAAVYADALVDDELSLRPAWSVDLLRSGRPPGDPFVVRAEPMRATGWAGGASAADRLDLALRLSEMDATLIHVPDVLAAGPAPPLDRSALARMVGEHIVRVGLPARARAGTGPSPVELEPRFTDQPSISVVIPTAGTSREMSDGNSVRLVDRCVAGLDGCDWSDIEIVAVVGPEYDGDPGRLAELSTRWRMKLVRRRSEPFSFPDAVNRGVLASAGDLVLVLNDDTEALDPTWMARLAMRAVEPSVGAVGAGLVYPDGTVQHLGVVIDDARPLHPFVGTDVDRAGPDGIGAVARTVVAVTGACLMARRADFLAVGGLTPELPMSYNDVDLCLKLARQGLRTVMEPAARLIHHESASRPPVIDDWEWDRFVGRWGEIEDPWYHPGYFRPRDPDRPRLDVDHLLPGGPPAAAAPRDGRLRSRVHHSRTTVPDPASAEARERKERPERAE
ncbi:MAG: glycosyltransferase [Acidimicrobiales bacterium]